MAHVLEAPYLDGRKTPVKLEALEAAGDNIPDGLKAMRDNMRAGFASRRFAVDQLVGDGEVLPFCGGIIVLHTPGHTPGHICLYRKDGGVLITGDALNVVGGMLTGPNADYSLDIDEAVRSVRKLQGLDIQTVICYHGGIFQGDMRTALEQIVS
ncbi:MAG: MBL fold metallo-hydrolase [Oscillospiraceae bacterium]|nr:MBL fold metallo-hydrolase [Oscillospiraceae bacterium]